MTVRRWRCVCTSFDCKRGSHAQIWSLKMKSVLLVLGILLLAPSVFADAAAPSRIAQCNDKVSEIWVFQRAGVAPNEYPYGTVIQLRQGGRTVAFLNRAATQSIHRNLAEFNIRDTSTSWNTVGSAEARQSRPGIIEYEVSLKARTEKLVCLDRLYSAR